MMRYDQMKRLLFKLDPELAHTLAGVWLKSIAYCPPLLSYLKGRYFVDEAILHQRHFGRLFRNPIGLAAGFDKNGEYLYATPTLGFGFSEVGTVTPKPQPGNEKPRLFRLTEDEALQNAMGFNNKGALYMLKRLKSLYFFDYPVGINIGKNKATPQMSALDDYAALFKAFRGVGDYMVVNISSPNTPGLRDLQNESFIKEVFALAKAHSDKSVLLKIAPDMSVDDALRLAQSAIDAGAKGVIATNTTVDYSLATSPNKKEFGGLSGAVLKEKSFELFKELGKAFYGKTLLISVGGIDSADEAYRRIRAGASLLQIYTSLIYHGPALITKINHGLIARVKRDGFSHISQAIGIDVK